MNAFELMASALDISPIFDDQNTNARANTRFLSKEEPTAIVTILERTVKARRGKLTRISQSRYCDFSDSLLIFKQTCKALCTLIQTQPVHYEICWNAL